VSGRLTPEEIKVGDFVVAKFSAFGRAVSYKQVDVQTIHIDFGRGDITAPRKFLSADPEDLFVWVMARLVKEGLL
jgi:hypothetical protein